MFIEIVAVYKILIEAVAEIFFFRNLPVKFVIVTTHVDVLQVNNNLIMF